MQFDSGLSLFQFLISKDAKFLKENLAALSQSVSSDVYQEALALIDAHEENQANASGFTYFIGSQAHQLSDDDALYTLLGRQVGVFKIIEQLGAGGMGVVYLGERNDGKIQQRVALKFVFPSIANLAGDEFIHREAQCLADLNHPNIAKIYSLGTIDDGFSYLQMEYIDGISVDDYIAKDNGIEATLALLAKLANALEQAHHRSIVHADVKPSNIKIDESGEPKLLDFGVASSVDVNDKDRLTALSSHFSSPAIRQGKQPTPQDDIYSLGKVMEYMLQSYPVSLEQQAVIQKAVANEPEERFQNMREFEAALQALMNNQPLYWYRNSFVYLYKKWFHRSPLSAAAVAFLPVILLISTVLVTVKNDALRQEMSKNRELVDFYDGLFLTPSATTHSGNVLSAADFIGSGVDVALAQTMSDESTRVTVLTTLARSLIKLGFLSRASQIAAQLEDDDPQTYLLKSVLAFELQKFGEASRLLKKYHEAFAPSLDSELLAIKIRLASAPASSVASDLKAIKTKYRDIPDPQREFELKRMIWESALAESPGMLFKQLAEVDSASANEYQRAWIYALYASAYIQLTKLEEAEKAMRESLRVSEFAFNQGNPAYSHLLKRLYSVAASLEDGRTAAIILNKQQSLYEYLSPILNTELLNNYEQQINFYANAKMWRQSLFFAMKGVELCNKASTPQCERIYLKHAIALYSTHDYASALEHSASLLDAGSDPEIHFFANLVYLNSRTGTGVSNSVAALNTLADSPLAKKYPGWVIATAIRSGHIEWATNLGQTNKSLLSKKGVSILADALLLDGQQKEAAQLINTLNDEFVNQQVGRQLLLEPETIVPFELQSELVYELEGGDSLISTRRVDGVVSPSHEAVLTIGEPYTLKWRPEVIEGESLTFYINHTMYFSTADTLSWENIKDTQWQMFAHSKANTGSLEIDPHSMMANGIAGFKVLMVSDKGYWSLSDGLFSVNTGNATDIGLRQLINPLLLVDAVSSPQAYEVYNVGEKNKITWDPSVLKGRHDVLQ